MNEAETKNWGQSTMARTLSKFIPDVGRVRHVFCAVTRRMRHGVMRKEGYGLLRNGWRVTQPTLTRPTFCL